MTTLEDLITNRAKRGAWIGLFPTTGAAGIADPHLTIAHLGRDLDAEPIHKAHDLCAAVATRTVAPLAKIDGTARLEQKAGSALVLLLRDADLISVVTTIQGWLQDSHIYYDRKFPFRAHLTMRRLKVNEVAEVARVNPDERVMFDQLGLVVGDHRVLWPLTGQPTFAGTTNKDYPF